MAQGRPRGKKRLLAILRALGLVLAVLLIGWGIFKGPDIGPDFMRGNWAGLLGWILTSALLIHTSVTVLFSQYEDPPAVRDGLWYWIATVFMGQKQVQLVLKDGSVKTVEPTGPLANIFAKLGAPGIVIIDNGMAVVMERSGRFTQVKGSGIAFTRQFEKVAHVIDLRTQVRTRPVRNIISQDGLSFNLDRLDVLFEVAAGFRDRGGYGFEAQAIMDLVFGGGLIYEKGQEVEWGDRVAGIVEALLRDIAATQPLERIVRIGRGSARQKLIERLEDMARPELRKYGIRLIGIDLGQIRVPKELEGFLTMPLVAETQRDTLKTIASGIHSAIEDISGVVTTEMGDTMHPLMGNAIRMLERYLGEFQKFITAFRSESEPRLLGRGELPETKG